MSITYKFSQEVDEYPMINDYTKTWGHFGTCQICKETGMNLHPDRKGFAKVKYWQAVEVIMRGKHVGWLANAKPVANGGGKAWTLLCRHCLPEYLKQSKLSTGRHPDSMEP